MSELFRETYFGHAVRWLTGNKVLQYPEERIEFELPPGYSTSNRFAPPHGEPHGDKQSSGSPPPGIGENIIEGQAVRTWKERFTTLI